MLGVSKGVNAPRCHGEGAQRQPQTGQHIAPGMWFCFISLLLGSPLLYFCNHKLAVSVGSHADSRAVGPG